MTFEPTHQCFDDALDLLSIVMKKHRHFREQWRLVHAICKVGDNLFAHAWCERDREVVVTAFIIEGTLTYVEMRRRDFYKLFLPQMMTKYNPWEAMRENARANHFGPWLDCYREHCGGNEILGAVQVEIKQ